MVRNEVGRGGFSKCPEIHGRVLEKWDGVGSRIRSGYVSCFHFSTVNYGYYCLYFFLRTLFPITRRRCGQGVGNPRDSFWVGLL